MNNELSIKFKVECSFDKSKKLVLFQTDTSFLSLFVLMIFF